MSEPKKKICGKCEFRKCVGFVIKRKVWRCMFGSVHFRVGEKAECYQRLKQEARDDAR